MLFRVVLHITFIEKTLVLSFFLFYLVLALEWIGILSSEGVHFTDIINLGSIMFNAHKF